jgi:penicillin-binding protein 2
MGGQMYTPHLLLRAVAGIDRKGEQQLEKTYKDENNENKFSVPMSKEIHDIVLKGMWTAVEAGTAGSTRIEGFDVCAKTGTAQVASTERVGSEKKDHAWIIGFAPRDKPEIAIVVLTENVGFGSAHSAPRAKQVLEDYYRRTRGLPPKPEETQAAKSGSGPRVGSPGVRTGRPDSKPPGQN